MPAGGRLKPEKGTSETGSVGAAVGALPSSRAARLGKAVRSVIAGAMIAATLIPAASFVLARIGLDAYADALLADLFLPAFLVLATLLSLALDRIFRR